MKHFCDFYPELSYILSNKEELDEILEIGNGDARKTLINVYNNYVMKRFIANGSIGNHKNVRKFNGKSKSEHKLKLENNKKIPLFHLIGKLLYAKRLDTSLMKSRAFSRE